MATPTTSDGELLIRTVYDRYARALHGYVTSLLDGDRPGADDVVQETALRAWRHADRLDATGAALRPWLFKVAKRIVIDRYRQRQARPEVAGATVDSLTAPDATDATLSAMVVTEALRQLSRPHREVLREMYFRGSSVEEAARTLGVPPGTVKSRTYYALRALRLALEERGLTG